MIRLSRHHPGVRLDRGYRLAGLCVAACIFFLMGAAEARAQFSGPATSSTAGYNQELTATTDRAILYPGERDIVLTIGDDISIRLFSDSKYTAEVRINNDGTVLLPLIGIVHLEGLSVTQAENLIAEKLESADPSDHRGPERGRHGDWRDSRCRSDIGYASSARCPLHRGRLAPNRKPRHYDQSSWRCQAHCGRSWNRSHA